MTKTLLILGGYGNAGKLIADLLLKETNDTHIIIAGRSIERAQEQADKLNETYSGERVEARQVDASSSESLQAGFRDIDLVVVASSTTEYTYQVVEAALEANADYFDLQTSISAKWDALKSLKPRIDSSSQCFITDGGYHPGLPAALVRYAATQCTNLQTAKVYTIMHPDLKDYAFSEGTFSELLMDISGMSTQEFTNGQWEKCSWTTYYEHDFGEPFKTQYVVPMFLEELRDLPGEIPSLEETGFYISGFNPVTDYCFMPLGVCVAWCCPISFFLTPVSRLFLWSMKRFTAPPYGNVITLEAHGAAQEQESTRQPVHLNVSVSHEDLYMLTCVPAVACLLQMLDGSAMKPGLHCQALVVEPKRFLADMEHMGLDVTIEKHGTTTGME